MTAASSDPWWRSTWCVARGDWLRLVAALVAVVVGGSLVGLVLTDWAAPNPITDLDRRVAEWFVDVRTVARNDVAHWGAFPADTNTKIAVTAAVAIVLLWRWKRWHEVTFVVLTLVFEATAFITITAIVRRPRPAVVRLLDSPVASSFPSGHVAAATVYSAFAVIVFWRTRATWARATAILLTVLVVFAVGAARLYQGMHFLSDVVAGVVLGLVSLAACARILGAPDTTRSEPPVESPVEQPAEALERAPAGFVDERVPS